MELKKISNYVSYISPCYVYLPIDSKENIKIRKDKKVFLGSTVASNNKYNTISSVSGKVIGLENVVYSYGEKTSLVIENNFLDKKQKIKGCKKIISNYLKKDANEILETYNLKRKFLHKKILLINTTRFKNYLCMSPYTLIEKTMEFLEAIDALCDIYDINANIILTKEDIIIAESLKNYIRMYPKIKIEYINKGVNNEELIKKHNKKEEYIIYNEEEIIKIYEALKRDNYYSYHHLIINDGVKNIYVKTKVGILLEELLSNLKIGKNLNTCNIITNERKEIKIKNFVITEEINIIEL